MSIRIKGTNYVYFPVPKCGSTSLKAAILEHNGRPRLGIKKEGGSPHDWRGWGSLPWRKDWPRYFRLPGLRPFTVIRDPIDRFVSAYRNQVVFHGHLGEEVPELSAFALSFESLCKTNKHLWHHFTPIVDYTGYQPEYYDRVFLLSELDQVSKYLGIVLNLRKEETGGPQVTAKELSAEAVAHLRSFYAEDYRVWGDYLGGPAARRSAHNG